MRYLLIAAALTGCASSPPTIIRDRVVVEIELTEALPAGIIGRAWCIPDGSWCQMQLRRSAYPRCATHEIRHLFEGAFHGNTPSTADCNTY